MATPRRHQQVSVPGVKVEEVKVEEVRVEEVRTEERGVEGVYQAMCDKIEEMYKVCMGLESSESAAALLKALETVKVHILSMMESARVQYQMELDALQYERDKEEESANN